MKSVEIQNAIYEWLKSANFDAPYGVLTSERTNSKGRKFLTVTFGRARTLDATVEIYNSAFMLLKTSRRENSVFKDFDSLMDHLKTL